MTRRSLPSSVRWATFACGWGKYCQVSLLAVCVNLCACLQLLAECRSARKPLRITMENRTQDMILATRSIMPRAVPVGGVFPRAVSPESPLKQKGLYTILDGVAGQGHYVGTYLAWRCTVPVAGEGEIKFFMDGDRQLPTIW